MSTETALTAGLEDLKKWLAKQQAATQEQSVPPGSSPQKIPTPPLKPGSPLKP